MRELRLGFHLGLFQLSLGILGVLILGLLNRLLIQDIQVPAALAALAIGGQQLMGFTRIWFGNWSDRIPLSRLRRTPFILFLIFCQARANKFRSPYVTCLDPTPAMLENTSK